MKIIYIKTCQFYEKDCGGINNPLYEAKFSKTFNIDAIALAVPRIELQKDLIIERDKMIFSDGVFKIYCQEDFFEKDLYFTKYRFLMEKKAKSLSLDGWKIISMPHYYKSV